MKDRTNEPTTRGSKNKNIQQLIGNIYDMMDRLQIIIWDGCHWCGTVGWSATKRGAAKCNSVRRCGVSLVENVSVLCVCVFGA